MAYFTLQRLVQFFTLKMYTWHTVNGEDILEISLRLLGLIFSDVMESTSTTKIFSAILRVVSLNVTGLFVANLFVVDDIGEFAKAFEGAMVALQTSNDQIFGLAFRHNELVTLIKKRKKFWLPKSVDPDDKCGRTAIQKTTLIFANVFGVVLFCCLLCYISNFVLTGSLDIWVPKSHPHISLALKVYALSWGLFAWASTLTCNLLITSFCVDTAIQFKLLNFRLNQLENNISENQMEKDFVNRELREIAAYHVFLLDFWNGIRYVFSIHMFVRILETMGTLCMNLFILSANDSSFYNLARSFLMTGSLVMQVVFMVTSAEIVNEESSMVLYHAYDSPWTKHPEITSYIKLIMIRAMTPCTLTAGGFIEINKPMMTAVIKTTVSYFTAMRTLAN